VTIPQHFQYQGSKRALAPLILQYLPVSTTRLLDPFCGSAALSIAAAARGRAREFWLNDFNAPLARLLSLIVNNPKELGNPVHPVHPVKTPFCLCTAIGQRCSSPRRVYHGFHGFHGCGQGSFAEVTVRSNSHP
jgi:site-specific DNA-adenine methylase